jgi:hypothetical protein
MLHHDLVGGNVHRNICRLLDHGSTSFIFRRAVGVIV